MVTFAPEGNLRKGNDAMDRILIVDDALDLGRLWQTALRYSGA